MYRCVTAYDDIMLHFLRYLDPARSAGCLVLLLRIRSVPSFKPLLLAAGEQSERESLGRTSTRLDEDTHENGTLMVPRTWVNASNVDFPNHVPSGKCHHQCHVPRI